MSKQLDWLAEEILTIFAELGFDAPYIEDKRNTLAGMDRFAVLVWCHNLGTRRKAILANRLGVSYDDLSVTLKTLAKL